MPFRDKNRDEISTIRAGQGAHVTTRKNAAEAADRARKSAERRYAERHPEARAPKAGPQRSALNIVLLVVAAVLALAVVFALGTLVTSLVFPPAEEQTTHDQTLRPTESEMQVQEEQREHDAGSEQVGADGSTVSYAGETYALRQGDDGTWGVVNTVGDVIIALEGTPYGLLRTADTLLIPENRDGGWDVVSYVIGGHLSGVTYVVGPDGNPVGGAGDVTSAELEGTTLRVTDSTGATTDVALA